LQDEPRINRGIRAPELRVVGEDGKNIGVLSLEEAFRMAQEEGLDLIEISPKANPPIAKIMDFGKYQYLLKKKSQKSKGTRTETKTLQVKIGTGEHDLELKSRKASEFLKEGHRVKIDLFLQGRAKYLDEGFLRERLERILHLMTEEYKIADGPKKSPKGLSVIIERGKKQ
jgi:translation initiation factor IF-3